MDPLVAIIKSRLAAGEQLPDVILDLKKQGKSDAEISEAFKSAVASDTPASTRTSQITPNIVQQKPQESVKEAPSLPSTERRKIDATKVFVIIGALLIVAAIIAAGVSEWSKVGAFGKVSFLALPMIVLFAVSLVLSKKEHLREYHNWTLAIGYFILPFFLGTLFLQYKLFPEFGPLVLAYILLISLAVYLVTEYLFKKYYLAVFSVLSAFGLALSLLVRRDSSEMAYVWILLAISVCVLAVGFITKAKKMANSNIYLTFGTLTVMAAVPTAILYTINDDRYIGTEANLVIFSLFGLSYLFLAAFYNQMRARLDNGVFYSLKRFCEEIAPFTIIIPYLMAGGNYLFVAFILSLSAILLSLKLWINSLLYIGAIGLVVSVLMISSEIFADSIGWPLMVLIAGFSIIGLGLGIKKIVGIRKEQANHGTPFGLGKDPAMVASNSVSGGRIALWIIGSIVGLILLWQGISALYMAQQEREWKKMESKPTPVNSSSPSGSSSDINSTSVGTFYGSIVTSQIDFNSSSSSFGSIDVTDQSDSITRFSVDILTRYFLNGSEISKEAALTEVKSGVFITVEHTQNLYANRIYFRR